MPKGASTKPTRRGDILISRGCQKQHRADAGSFARTPRVERAFGCIHLARGEAISR